MTTKKTKRPDQEVYRPPKSESNVDKAHERTFYNSNHKKKPTKVFTEERQKTKDNITSRNYQENSSEISYSNYDNYNPHTVAYQDDIDYIDDYPRRHTKNDNYKEPGYKLTKRYDYNNQQKQKLVNYDTKYQKEDNYTNTNHFNASSKPSNNRLKLDDRRTQNLVNNEATISKSQLQETTEQPDMSGRCRQNTHNKDFQDSRLFNPYKSDVDTFVNKPTVVRPQNVYQAAPTHATTRPTRSKDIRKPDSHIHGGIIHLPDNVAITSSPSSAHGIPNAEYNSKMMDQKPTVMVRPTLSQLNTPNAIQYPPVSFVHGFQTPSGFIPVQPTMLSPMSFMRPSTSMPQMTPDFSHMHPSSRFPQAPMLQTPDEVVYPIQNIKNQAVVQAVNKIRALETQMDVFLRSTFDPTSNDWWASVNQIRTELMDLYRIVIVSDLDFCNQANIEQNLWKSVFYSVMEIIRAFLLNPEYILAAQNRKDDVSKVKEAVTNQGREIIQTGEEFFVVLYTAVAKQHGQVNLEAIFQSRRPPPETGSRTRKLVYLSAQKLLLFLGDLARYAEIISGTNEYSKSRIWYLKAQLLVPKNGRPYNQLAVISIYGNRHLDALYYYTRTLAASNPFSTASQCLSFLFEDARRKGDELLRRQMESLKRKKKKQSSGNDNRKKGCIEIWIHPDDGSKEKKVTDDDDTDVLATFDGTDDGRLKSENLIGEDYLSMPLIELNKLFILSFLNSHGKLFVKINMENFPEVCSTMLQELWALLSHRPCPLSGYRLCHMLIINMYIMDRVSSQPGAAGNSSHHYSAVRSLHQDHASRMTLDFFALLCQRAIELITEWLESEQATNRERGSPLCLSPDLSAMLAPLCLWTDWMVTHPEYWSPPPSHRDPLLPPCVDDFGLIARLCSLVARIVSSSLSQTAPPPPRYRVVTDIRHAEQLIGNPASLVLFEENLISGFLPMLDQIPKIYLVEDDVWSREQIEDWIHLEKLSLFGDFLCGINPPVLDYEVQTGVYVSVVMREGSERPQDGPKVVASKEEELPRHKPLLEDDLDLKLQQEIDEIHSAHGCHPRSDSAAREGTTDNDGSHPTSWADITDECENEERQHQRRIAELKIRRANVKIRDEKNRRYEEWRQSLLDNEWVQRFVELEIRPLFLVLDTNCYIDYLHDIDLLHSNGRYIVVVPLIVVNELENLSRTVQPKDDVDINERARAALRFVEDKFDKANPNFKAITSRGNFMQTIAYRAEALNLEEGETNDDVILNCCQFLCKDKPSEFMPRERDRPITLHREVVLLTGDRNLRLKALSRHIPVKPLKLFLSWAQIGKKTGK